MSRFLSPALGLAVALVVSACSGTGPVDSEPPRVAESSPADAAVVPVDAAVWIRFDEDIALDTLTDARFHLQEGSSDVAGTILYDAEAFTATFSPDGRLSYGATYAVVLEAGVEDLAGNAMPDMFSWSFETPAEHPAAVGIPGAGLATHDSPRLAVDDDGNALSVWRVDGSGGVKVVAAYYDAGSQSWGVEENVAVDALMPDVASAGVDDFMIVWAEGAYSSRSLMSRRFDGATYEAPVAVESLGGSAWNPRIASDGTGYAVTWRHQLTRAELYAAVHDGSTGWGALDNLEPVGSITNDTRPEIASNGTGYAVAWQSMGGSNSDIHVSVNTGSSFPANPHILEGGADFGSLPRVASNGVGYAVAWYQQADADNTWSVYASIGDGTATGFQPTPTEIDNGMANAYTPSVSAHGSGYAVAYRQDDGVALSAYARLGDGTSTGWDASEALLEASDGEVDAIEIRAAGDDLMVVFRQDMGGELDIRSAFHTSDAWMGAATLDIHDEDADAPALGSHAGGFVTAYAQPRGMPTASGLSGRVHDLASWGADSNLVTLPHRTQPDDASVATNDAGDSLIVWEQGAGGERFIFASAYHDGAFEPVLSISELGARSPRVASDGQDFMVAWESATNDIETRRYDPSARSWDSAVALGEVNADQPALAASADGYALAWYGDGDVLMASFHGAGGWSASHDLTSGADSVDSPVIASDGTGYTIAWVEWVGGGDPVLFARTHDGVDFTSTTPRQVATSTMDIADVDIAGGEAGYLLSFTMHDGDAQSAFASRGDGTTNGWTLPAESVEDRVDDDPNSRPSPAVSRAGFGVAFSMYDGIGGDSIYANVHGSGGWLSTPGVVDGPSFDSAAPSLASNGKGYLVAFRADDGLTVGGVHAALRINGSWQSTPWLLQPGNDDDSWETSPPLVAVRGGRYDVVWTQSDSADTLDPHLRRLWALMGL